MASLVGGVADLLLALSGAYFMVTGVGFRVSTVLVGSMVALVVRFVAGTAMLGGGVLLLCRRAAGRPVLATGAGLTLLAIVAIALHVIHVALVLNPAIVVFQYSSLICAIVALSTVFTGSVSTALNAARDHRRPGPPPPHGPGSGPYPPGQNAPGAYSPGTYPPGDR